MKGPWGCCICPSATAYKPRGTRSLQAVLDGRVDGQAQSACLDQGIKVTLCRWQKAVGCGLNTGHRRCLPFVKPKMSVHVVLLPPWNTFRVRVILSDVHASIVHYVTLKISNLSYKWMLSLQNSVPSTRILFKVAVMLPWTRQSPSRLPFPGVVLRRSEVLFHGDQRLLSLWQGRGTFPLRAKSHVGKGRRASGGWARRPAVLTRALLPDPAARQSSEASLPWGSGRLTLEAAGPEERQTRVLSQATCPPEERTAGSSSNGLLGFSRR